jgi:hypothetical protein
MGAIQKNKRKGEGEALNVKGATAFAKIEIENEFRKENS